MEVDQKYLDWIKENVINPNRMCVEMTLQMQEAFPELKRVRGHFFELCRYERPHWWLVAPNGCIVDPTRSQFTTGFYQEWDESAPEPTGKCPNCGDFCYNGDFCCSENCHISYVAYCNNPGSYF